MRSKEGGGEMIGRSSGAARVLVARLRGPSPVQTWVKTCRRMSIGPLETYEVGGLDQ